MKIRTWMLCILFTAGLCACTPAAPEISVPESTQPAITIQPVNPTQAATQPVTQPAGQETDVQSQIRLLAANGDTWLSRLELDQYIPYQFAVTDLDRNGRLELLLSTFQGTGHYSYNYLWQVDPQTQTLTECPWPLGEGESPADLTFNQEIPCYYDENGDVYHYIFTDLLKIGAAQYLYSIRSVTLDQGVLSEETLAVHQESYDENGSQHLSWEDAQGNAISREAYDAAAAEHYAGLSVRTVEFAWLSPADADFTAMDPDTLAQYLDQSYQGFLASIQ